MKMNLSKALPVLALLASGAAQAVPFNTGDVFAAIVGGVRHYDAAGNLLETITTGGGSFNTGMAITASGDVLVTNFGINQVGRIAGPGDPHTTSLFANQSGNPESAVIDSAGNVYVSSASTGLIVKYSSTGTVLGSIDVGARADFIDLQADQDTILFTTEGNFIGRASFSTATVLSSFASGYGGQQAFALRIRDNGEVLLADNGQVRRFSSTGTLLQSYTVGTGGLFALNLAIDGTSFWTGSFTSGTLYRVDIATGAILQTINVGVGSNSLFGVAVYGERTAGCGNNCGGGGKETGVPEPGTLALLGLGLAGLGVTRRRKAK